EQAAARAPPPRLRRRLTELGVPSTHACDGGCFQRSARPAPSTSALAAFAPSSRAGTPPLRAITALDERAGLGDRAGTLLPQPACGSERAVRSRGRPTHPIRLWRRVNGPLFVGSRSDVSQHVDQGSASVDAGLGERA